MVMTFPFLTGSSGPIILVVANHISLRGRHVSSCPRCSAVDHPFAAQAHLRSIREGLRRHQTIDRCVPEDRHRRGEALDFDPNP